jgi:hypothetical protein
LIGGHEFARSFRSQARPWECGRPFRAWRARAADGARSSYRLRRGRKTRPRVGGGSLRAPWPSQAGSTTPWTIRIATTPQLRPGSPGVRCEASRPATAERRVQR